MQRSNIITALVNKLKAVIDYPVTATPFAIADLESMPMLEPKIGVYVWVYDSPVFKTLQKFDESNRLSMSNQYQEALTFSILVGMKQLDYAPDFEDAIDEIKETLFNEVLDSSLSPIMITNITAIQPDQNNVFWRRITINLINYLHK